MARAQDGDADAFAELYDRHSLRAFRVARALCPDSGRAEAAVQDGFLVIWHSRARFSPEKGAFKAWAMAIVKDRAVQDQALTPDETGTMLDSLRKLPAAEAEVIALAFFGGLSHSEIASQLDLPAGTVKGRMRLGLEMLRQRMGAPR